MIGWIVSDRIELKKGTIEAVLARNGAGRIWDVAEFCKISVDILIFPAAVLVKKSFDLFFSLFVSVKTVCVYCI